MKLLGCHIENFGKIHDFTYDFKDGLNIICEDNGWGKSTFAAFIRAMFYGLDGERKRSVEENERKKYSPWQGGAFGGTLDIEVQNKKYRITRLFDSPTPFELRDLETNLISKDFSAKIGEEIFKIGRESFLRTVFIDQKKCETNTTDDINAKISNLIEDSDDINNYEKAFSRLTDITNSLTPHRATGLIKKNENEITRLEQMVKNGNGLNDAIEYVENLLNHDKSERENAKQELVKLSEEQKETTKYTNSIARKEEWDKLKENLEKKKNQFLQSKEVFPNEIPEANELNEYRKKCDDLSETNTRTLSLQLSEEQLQEYKRLTDVYNNAVPTMEEIEEKLGEVKDYEDKQATVLKDKISEEEQFKFDELDRRFKDESGDVSEKIRKWNERNTKKQTFNMQEMAIFSFKTNYAQQHKKNSDSETVFLILGILFVAIGLALLVVNPFIAGAVVLVGIIFLILKFMPKKKETEVDQGYVDNLARMESQLNLDKKYVFNVDEEIKNYLAKHGRIFDENLVSKYLSDILEESIEYKRLKEVVDRQETLPNLTEINDAEAKIEAFISKYKTLDNGISYTEAIMTIKSESRKYIDYCNTYDEYIKYKLDSQNLQNKIEKYICKLGFTPEKDLRKQLEDIREELIVYENNRTLFEEAKNNKMDFEEKNDVSILENKQIPTNLKTLDEINEQTSRYNKIIEQLSDTISNYIMRLNQLSIDYEEWENNKENLSSLKEKQEKCREKYNRIEQVKTYLSQAKENMTSKYSAPLLSKYMEYYNLIAEDDVNYYMDANTNITFEEQGKQREIESMSSGYRDMVGICLRLALVEAMYQDEKPMLVMDDPFTNLDDNKVGNGKELLDKVALNYQIIYFTCSQSRV